MTKGISRTAPQRLMGSPFLVHLGIYEDRIASNQYPFSLPWLDAKLTLDFKSPVTFLVGENGTGKSTLLEAIAWACGFGSRGGAKDNSFAEGADGHALGRALHLAWRQKTADGFFLRAETFFKIGRAHV